MIPMAYITLAITCHNEKKYKSSTDPWAAECIQLKNDAKQQTYFFFFFLAPNIVQKEQLKNNMGGTGLKFETWKVKNHTQNASHHHFYCFLKEIWILKSSYGLKRPIHGKIIMPTVLPAVEEFWSRAEARLDRLPPRLLGVRRKLSSMCESLPPWWLDKYGLMEWSPTRGDPRTSLTEDRADVSDWSLKCGCHTMPCSPCSWYRNL